MLTIDLQTARRFILGKHGLWPGRRGFARITKFLGASRINAEAIRSPLGLSMGL